MFVIAFFLCFVLQICFAGSSASAFLVPDLVLLVALTLALDFPCLRSLFVVFLLGLVGDAASGKYLGPSAGGMVAAYLLVHLFHSRVHSLGLVGLAVLACFCSLAKSVVSTRIVSYFSPQCGFDWNFAQQIMFEALATGIFAPAVINLLRSTTRSGLSYARTTKGQWGK